MLVAAGPVHGGCPPPAGAAAGNAAMTTGRQGSLLLARHRRLLAVIAFLGLLVAAFGIFGADEHFSPETIQQGLLRHPVWGLLIYVGLFALGNLLQVPGWLFLAAAVVALGPAHGGAVAYLAAATACVATFLIVRQIGGDALREFHQPWARRLFAQLDASPELAVAGLRLMFQTMPALNVALGLSGIPFRAYLSGTLLGLPLPITAYCLFFDQIARLLGRGS